MQPPFGKCVEVNDLIDMMMEAVGTFKRGAQGQQQRAPGDRHSLSAGYDDAGMPGAFPAGAVKCRYVVRRLAAQCTEVAFDDTEVAGVKRLPISGQLRFDAEREQEVAVIEAIECHDD